MELLSATQLKVFAESPLDYAMRYIEKLPTEKGPALLKGTAFHSWVRFLITGYPIDNKIFEGMNEYDLWTVELQAKALVAREEVFFKNNIWVFEQEFCEPLVKAFNDVKFRGALDLLNMDDKPLIYDIKTCTETLTYTTKTGKVVEGKFYGKTLEELKTDIQLMVYTTYVFDVDEVIKLNSNVVIGKVGHVQAISKKRCGKVVDFDSKIVDFEITPEYVINSEYILRGHIERILEFKKLYKDVGLQGVIKHYETKGLNISQLASKKLYGANNPYYPIYENKITIEEFKNGTIQNKI